MEFPRFVVISAVAVASILGLAPRASTSTEVPNPEVWISTFDGLSISSAPATNLQLRFIDPLGRVTTATVGACDLAVGCWVPAPPRPLATITADIPAGVVLHTSQGDITLDGPNRIVWDEVGTPSAVWGPEHEGLLAAELGPHS